MGAATDYLEAKLLDHSLGTTAYTKPSAVYLSLHTASPGETGSLTSEVSLTGTAYARQPITFNASSVGTGTATSSATVTFTAATASWGLISYIGISDASTGGNMLYYGAVTTSKQIDSGDTFSVTAGNLSISLD
jgi:hypothetical protein